MDNADLKNVEKYVDNTCKALHRHTMVVIKSTKESGDIRLRANSHGLVSNYIIIKTDKN